MDGEPPRAPAATSYFFSTGQSRRRGWWGLLAIVILVFGFILATFACFAVALVAGADMGDLMTTMSLDEITTTPDMFVVNNISIALVTVVAILGSLAAYQQGIGRLTSVFGRIRWRWMGQAALVAAVTFVPLNIVMNSLSGWGDLHWRDHTVYLLVAILITTPLQAAGEEYGFRSLLGRAVAGFIPRRLPAVVVAGVVTSAVFMVLHMAGDPWLNLYYFCLGALLFWLMERTGGAEAAIALHVVNNLAGELTMPWADIADAFARGDGSGSPFMLVILAVDLVTVLAIDWLYRRRSGPDRQGRGAVGPAAHLDALGDGLLERVDVGHHADGPAAGAQAAQLGQHVVQDLGRQGPETLVDEQRAEVDAAGLRRDDVG
jgi:membrane protease YdiL (CAAX protease family)